MSEPKLSKYQKKKLRRKANRVKRDIAEQAINFQKTIGYLGTANEVAAYNLALREFSQHLIDEVERVA